LHHFIIRPDFPRIILLEVLRIRKGHPTMGSLPHIHKGKNKASQLKEFRLFSNLPPELRILVWQFASQEIRVITVKNSSQTTRGEDLKATHDAETVPSILHTCQESRAISQNYYKLRLGATFHQKPIYFSYDHDVLHFPQIQDLVVLYRLAKRNQESWVEWFKLKDNLKTMIIGSDFSFLVNVKTHRFWKVENFYIQDLDALRRESLLWPLGLEILETRWKTQSTAAGPNHLRGGMVPELKSISGSRLEYLMKRERVRYTR